MPAKKATPPKKPAKKGEPRQTIVAHTITVRERRSDQRLPVGAVPVGKTGTVDVLQVIADELKRYEKSRYDAPKSEAQFWTQLLKKDGRILRGTVMRGKYGRRENLVNRKKPPGTKPDYERNVDDAGEAPFHFRVEAPKSATEVLVLSHQVSGRGIHSIVWAGAIGAALKDAIPDHVIETSHYYPDSVWKHIVSRGQARRITARWLTVPADLADSLSMDPKETEHAYAELVVKPQRGRSLRTMLPEKVHGANAQKKAVGDALKLQFAGSNVEADQLDVTAVLPDGQEVTVELREDTTPRASYKVTPVKYDADGFATYDSVIAFADAKAAALRRSLGW